MLNLSQIEQQYPESLRPFKRHILREYLQYKILEIIFNSKYSKKLSFLGGTSLRIIYSNTRFSEDLDFDNFDLQDSEFKDLSKIVYDELKVQGLNVSINQTGKNAFRCNIRFSDILYENELSPHEGEKILVQIDSLSHGFNYIPDKKIINKFDVFSEIFVTPIDILLSQKFFASVNRKTPKGRDFFDIIFLLSLTKPNYKYLQFKMEVNNADELKEKLFKIYKDFDFKELSKDVRNFVFNTEEVKRVEKFREFITQAVLD